ncbi:hypothetical protein BEL04_12160 [Mucilaginibacter sp. PPCGB 2223]|uniref:hypothetical protein n=1 Tax=Mucilaginibacter sp. PPCGB 2223 TaxID=1886027 RepID=UPI000825BCE7|nr:hypothetical protein [Mucilaginibacter sp. PPCGB 2223]OCX52231.1 hypothetical protein BEL04_12160 [Mucilaginibacter sp. PPCGB 2223]
MINPKTSIIKRLMALQSKHGDYFRSHGMDIFSIIVINRQTSGVSIIGDDVPLDLKYDIESIFYIR